MGALYQPMVTDGSSVCVHRVFETHVKRDEVRTDESPIESDRGIQKYLRTDNYGRNKHNTIGPKGRGAEGLSVDENQCYSRKQTSVYHKWLAARLREQHEQEKREKDLSG